MKISAKLLLALAASASLGGCAVLDGVRGDAGKKNNTPTVGNRVDILGTERDMEVDPALANVAVILPPAVVNEAWAQPGGNASKSPGHVELGQGLSRIWSANVTGANPRARLAASPVVSDSRVYVVDTTARVTALDANSGAQIWSNALEIDDDGKPSRFGGGVSATSTMVFATNGVGDVAALAADTGALSWKKRPAGPLRGAPTLSNGNVYVMTQDNQIYALRQTDGEAQWNEAGPVSASGIFGVGAPAAAQGTIIAGYSSGELAAYRYENGRSLWTDTLSRTAMSTSVSTLTDIDADPVIDRGRVFALGKGGRMASYELVTGQRIWEINIAGISTPVTAGEWVFVMTDEARLLCVARSSGKIRWISKLQRYDNEEKKKGPISWYGPVLAGGRLIVASSRGNIWSISPAEGTASEVFDLKSPVSLAPIVANNTLYILDDSGRISAFRG
ncbi:PQQ-binding-like beta-propeller repeat protein [Sphingorhabdus lacus]|uniref:Pyrrolo-quinoline quinone n=1 Tax=Sphingorhabdus lacus TaxID=392610 RepID=A0A6I6L6W9_9SPHN|nr:PQQ-binding-like beta-propeller repeat protein [Sphingorhabdus lacus]QGY81589.1 pyrrolo-quinoline quinone [Sphingorhabdus lacus]HPV66751.1 PQQ-like beta-propeller repeat protein [Sphingorhabdus lacus]